LGSQRKEAHHRRRHQFPRSGENFFHSDFLRRTRTISPSQRRLRGTELRLAPLFPAASGGPLRGARRARAWQRVSNPADAQAERIFSPPALRDIYRRRLWHLPPPGYRRGKPALVIGLSAQRDLLAPLTRKDREGLPRRQRRRQAKNSLAKHRKTVRLRAGLTRTLSVSGSLVNLRPRWPEIHSCC